MSIVLPRLPYANNALEPYMSQNTLEYHYGKHHKNYVDTLNRLIDGTALEELELEEIMASTLQVKQKIYNNAAQAWNHEFFWNCLTPRADEPSKELQNIFVENFSSFDQFKEEFEEQANEQFGSGWAWLVKDVNGNLKIRSLPEAGNPLIEFNEIPLLTCDVWEHAYYLDYKNERSKYLRKFWHLVNWDFVEGNLSHKVELYEGTPAATKDDFPLHETIVSSDT